MSTPNTGTCLSCQDSGLSITGNVIGILTLAYALAAGFYLYYNSFKNAKRELYDLENILEARYHEASHLESMLIPLTHTHTGGPHYQQVYRIQEASERSKDFLNEARELLYRLHSRRGAPSTRSRVFIAGRFIASKEKMVAMVGEAEKALVDLREAVNQVNSMGPSNQDILEELKVKFNDMSPSNEDILKEVNDLRRQQAEHAAMLEECLARIQPSNAVRRKSF